MQTGEPSGLQRVLDALNVLGRTRWCVLNVRWVEPRSLTYQTGASMTTCCQSWSKSGKTAAVWRRFLRPRRVNGHSLRPHTGALTPTFACRT